MSNSSITITLYSAFNLASAILDILSLVVCLIFLCVIMYRIVKTKYQHGRATMDVPLVLSINILLISFIKTTLQITHVTIPTLMKDFQIIAQVKETRTLQFRAYMLWSMIGVLYWSYLLLAFFRFVRVVYSTKLWLHRLSLYLYVLIPGQFIVVFIGMLPLIFIFNSFHLIPDEAYCSIFPKPIYSVLYSGTITFVIPMNMMCIFYMSIARKMRQTLAIRHDQQLHRRDLIVIRRMLLSMSIISLTTFPYSVLFIIASIRDQYDSVMYRIQWLLSSLGSCLFSFMLPLITTQLLDFLKSNRIVPNNNNT